MRVEFKGLRGGSPWRAELTRREREVGEVAGSDGSWWLLIVTRAQSGSPGTHWLDGAEAARVFSVPTGGVTAAGLPTKFRADRAVAAGLR